ncbi:MAG: c-type cytochrome [Armatimonadetes bacterium]|nr:c-type cytochrome [Armatimonadota bacterium]
MRDRIVTAIILACFALITIAMVSCGKAGAENGTTPQQQTTTATPDSASQHASRVERGKYLVTVGACNDCHTPMKMGPKGPERDMARMLAGHPEEVVLPAPPKVDGPWGMAFTAMTGTAYAGPWGITYAMNLTPDTATGLGNWSEQIFMLAIKEGKHFGGSRPIMPPMPWEMYKNMTDEDLKSIFAYLKSIPAVKNKVPEYMPPAGPMASK